MSSLSIKTERLLLNSWDERDLEPFAALNADPRVMECMPGCLDRMESDAAAARYQAHIEQHGFGMWAVRRRDSGEFIGFVGLNTPRFEAAFTPCVEIGWRLAFAQWGQGFATEAAQAAVGFGFRELNLNEIVSFTVPANVRSRAVMERVGFQRDWAGDFEHPMLAEGHPLRPHILYRLTNPEKL